MSFGTGLRIDHPQMPGDSPPGPLKMSIADIILFVGIQAMEANDDKIRLAYEQVKNNNAILQDLNKLMAYLATKKEGCNSSENVPGFEPAQSIAALCKKYNIDCPNGAIDKSNIEKLNVAVKGVSDATGGNNQIDMMKLQSTLNKQNEMSQMVSNNMSKMSQMMMAIIGNMR